MIVLNLMGLFLISFTFFNVIFSIRNWINLKNYTDIIKGIVNEVCLHDNKIIFNIKWHIPNEILEKNSSNKLNSVQYYAHIYKDVSKMNSFKKQMFLMKTQEKFSNQSFYLLLKKDNDIVFDIKPYTRPFSSAILNTIALILLFCGLCYINGIY